MICDIVYVVEKIRNIQETTKLKTTQNSKNVQAGQKNWFLISKTDGVHTSHRIRSVPEISLKWHSVMFPVLFCSNARLKIRKNNIC